MKTETIHPYVFKDTEILNGEPIFKETRTPVRAVVEFYRMGKSPEEIVISLPHLSLAQVFDGLSYFEDNQAEINQAIHMNSVPDDLIHPFLKDD